MPLKEKDKYCAEIWGRISHRSVTGSVRPSLDLSPHNFIKSVTSAPDNHKHVLSVYFRCHKQAGSEIDGEG